MAAPTEVLQGNPGVVMMAVEEYLMLAAIAAGVLAAGAPENSPARWVYWMGSFVLFWFALTMWVWKL